MKTIAIVLSTTWMLIPLGMGQSAPSRQEPLDQVMKQKLVYSQGILEGITRARMELVQKNARKLLDVIDQPGWHTLQSERYLQSKGEFRNAVRHLEQSSQDSDPSGAALAYVDMILECVQCHHFVRGVQRANLR